ncbi:MAG: hypothetical protein A3G87_10415 [Omnitrophica bacterium RIFCSPLOWO2_12_FULL_50_11]|nr:MAG: hypothetical protein A3G87_10415 [Omnitrophica bacterium RIFCSPLOWO2_12_FULL_50_11]
MELSFLALAGVFVSGLALNLTPCVYPMLTVTIALFGGQSERNLLRSFTKAFIYFVGIAVVYSILGVFAATTGAFFGSAVGSSWVLGLVSLVMFVLALSMFGLYEFQMPSSVANWFGGRRGTGNIGIFLSGLSVGVFAAPCIGPPIVALLTLVGQMADPVQGFFVFFVLSLGLGLPYLVLGTFSGLLQKLPRSGEWLVWVKKLFGFALLGLAAFYFALGFYSDLLSYVFPVTLIAAGIYLGFVDRTGDTSVFFRRFKRAAGSVALIIVFLTFMLGPRHYVEWEAYAARKIDLAREAQKPVILDFYADWCIPCHELERFTYSNPKVIEALEPFTRLKVDATDPTTEEAAEPIERFDVVGVPTILFLDWEGNEVKNTRITGYVPPEVFLESVEEVLSVPRADKAVDDSPVEYEG